MPATGCVSPHHSWPTPKARLMLASPRPVVELMTLRNSPIDCLAPIVTAKMPPAASSTSANGSAARGVRAVAVAASGIGRLLVVGGQAGKAVVEQRVQLGDAFVAELPVEGELRALPGALRVGALGAALRGDDDETRAAVDTRADLGPAVLDQRLQVAGQRRRFQRHRRGEVARPH